MASGYINAVYYPSWRVYKGFSPSKLQLELVTHVFYAFARVNEDGSLRVCADNLMLRQLGILMAA